MKDRKHKLATRNINLVFAVLGIFAKKEYISINYGKKSNNGFSIRTNTTMPNKLGNKFSSLNQFNCVD